MQFESFALYQHTRLPKEQELLRSREKAKLDHRIDGDEEHLSLLSTLQSLGNLDDHNSGEERVEPEKDLDEQMKEQIKLINEEIRQLQQEEEEIVEEERQAVSKQVKSADGVDIDELIDISLDLIAILDRALGNVGKIKRREETEEPREEDIFKLTQHIDEGLETPSFQGLYREGLEDKQLFIDSLQQIQVSSPKPRTETCYMLMENVGKGMGELTPLVEGAEEISEQEEEGTQEIDYKGLDKIQKEVHEAFVSIAEQAENAQKMLDGILENESSLGHDKECPLCNDRRR